MVEEILARSNRDKLLKWLDERNFFYPGSYLISKIVALIYGVKRQDYKEFSLIAQSHLDACWLWTRDITIKKNYITVNKALKHMEDYPFFKFAMSSPKYFEWTEKYFPEDFERMKERIREGRFELVGGMWIEPDLMAINGESMVRQRLYGQRYYLEKFGKMSEIGWLTDVFGYQWSLPQVLAKSGSKYFYTNKLGWMDQNEFPFSIFYWQAPDGTKVLTYAYSYSGNLFAMKQNWGNFKKFTRFVKESNMTFSYENSPEEIEKMRSKEYMENFGLVYGMGDGGGGPIREEIIIFKNFASRFPKKVKFTTMKEYFKKIEKYSDKIPTWNDEMYLEQHRGCLTSQVWIKEFNRKAEFMFYQFELLISLLQPFGFNFDNKKIKRTWQQLLFNQFHDILPGSSIAEVYVDAKKDFKDIFSNLKAYIKKALKFLGSRISFSGKGLLLFNSLPFERNALIEMDSDEAFSLKTINDRPVLVQQLNGKSIFKIKLPSSGYTIVTRIEKQVQKEETDLRVSENDSEITLENANLIIKISKKNGYITRLYSKTLQKEILTGNGNVIQIFMEKPGDFFAWNIDRSYSKNKYLPETESVTIVEEGPVRVGVRIEKTFRKQKITQFIYLSLNSSQVDMQLDMKFHVKKAMMKVAFPIDVETHDVISEIPFGIITRKTKPSNKFHEAQWEKSCRNFITLSDGDISVSLLNNGRYGFDSKYHDEYKNVLRLTIFRIPNYPRAGSPITSMFPSGKWHEQDEYSLKYSLLISKGKHTNPEIKQRALDLNVPVLIQEIANTKGDLPQELNFLNMSPSNVVLSSIKLPEDEPQDGHETMILRCYEALGLDSKCEIKLSERFKIVKVEEVDLLEFNPEAIEIHDENILNFNIKKFEIKTFKINFTLK
ncbi:MAG: alpha-mannosidase [Candidatus Helarchaeota archaeon]